MEKDVKQRLKYRRQYLLASKKMEPPFSSSEHVLGGKYYLYTHVDLPLHIAEKEARIVAVLGDIFDYRSPGLGNQDIANALLGLERPDMLEELSHCLGKYVVLCIEKDSCIALTDLTATKKVYFAKSGDKLMLCSQPHLLAAVLQLEISQDPSRQKYYQSRDFRRVDHSSIGSTTAYEEITQLLPNHFLDVKRQAPVRYWPNRPLEIKPHMDCVRASAGVVKGSMEAIANRYRIMLPVTAGSDSRLLLAGTREVKDSIYCYVNWNSGLSEKHNDLRIPAKLMKMLGYPFHINTLEGEVDPDFREVFFANNPMASERYLPHIYSYFSDHPDKVNLPGNFAAHPIGMNQLSEKNVNLETLSRLYGMSAYPHALEHYGTWLEQNRELCEANKVHLLRLFYLEERCANWMTQTQLDKEIAQDDLNPFNSRILIEYFWSVELKYNSLPDKRMNTMVTRLLWPELLKVPVNPGMTKQALKLLARMDMLKYLFRLKYKTAR